MFLDDLGANLKSAKEIGMKTILVKDTSRALSDLRVILESSKLTNKL